jgi:hypothetical protein
MIRLPFYSKKKLLLAVEYGVILSETAKQRGVELTPDMVKKMEVIVENEFNNKDATRVSVEMIPNILAVFETN